MNEYAATIWNNGMWQFKFIFQTINFASEKIIHAFFTWMKDNYLILQAFKNFSFEFFILFTDLLFSKKYIKKKKKLLKDVCIALLG